MQSQYSFADRIMDQLDELRRGIRGWSKADHSQYFQIACPHSDNVLALHNGSLMSVIRINGYMGQFFPEQFESLRNQWAKFFQTTSRDKTAKGFDLYWSYEYDPEGMGDRAHKYRRRMKQAAERRGLDIRDILDEEAEIYGKICAVEEQTLLVVTHIDSLSKSDQSEALKKLAKERRDAVRGASAISMQAGIKSLEALHEQHVNKVMVFLENAGMGYTIDRLDCYEALWSMRHAMTPGTTGNGWRARLTLRDCRFRPTNQVPGSLKAKQDTQNPLDWTFMLPPPLSEQMTPQSMIDLGRFVVVDDRTYAPLYISELAVDPQPLEDLLRMCYRRKLPIRMVYSLMANSNHANYWNRMFASIFTFASASNRQINKADKAMKAYQEGNGTVFGYGVSITTWAKSDITYDAHGGAIIDVKEVQKRAQDVETFLQQWGGQQIDSIFGCPVEGLMGATPGYSIPPACPKAPQIEMDIVAQLPLMRPARLWEPDNAIWFRTSEGVLLPYQPFSSRQNAMLTLVMGGMGYGKSNLLSEHIFYFANHPEADEIPYIRGIDFGASSSGVVSVVQDSLPANRKHEAVFESFSNNGKMVKNLLDTRLGARYPLDDHRRFLISWLLILCDSLLEMAGVSNMVSVMNATIQRAYELRDPKSHRFEPVPYMPISADPLVTELLEETGLVIDDATHYWEVVDALIAHGLKHNDDDFLHAAKVAQRRAVPQLSDLVRACDQLADQFRNMPDVEGKPLTAAISNALLSANSLFPCLAGITNTDVSESRICVFDMSEAFGRGVTPYDDWMRSVYFSVVYRLLTEDLFVNRMLSGDEMHKHQQNLGLSDELLDWHLAYLERQDQIIKIFWGDELHRIGKVHGAFTILDSMAYEGRKYKVGLLLGTQMPQHFPKDMLKLASSIFIFGASQSPENADLLKDLFELTKDERNIVLDITKPSTPKGAEAFVIHKTDGGVQRLKLHFQMGFIKRWAFATEPDERALRGILYREGPSSAWARRVLAERVPDANTAIKRQQALLGDEISRQDAVKDIAKELLKLVDK